VKNEAARQWAAESEDAMRLLTTIMQRIRGLVKLETFEPETCVLCGFGPNPSTGVPITCANGTRAHLACILGAAPRAVYSEAWRKAPIVQSGVLAPSDRT
jgi:hypothetical protein